MTQALILIDLQNDFLPGGALPVPGGDAVLPIANRAQRSFSEVVATQDWHPADHGSFASQHPDHQPGDVIDLAGLTQVLWPVHCVQHTRGAAFSTILDTSRIRRIFQKGTDPKVDSYSGFFDNARRKETGLAQYLRDRNVHDLYLLGLATDYCVKATALDARSLGFTTHLILDGCRGVELHAGDCDQALSDLRAAGVHLLQSPELEQSLR